jgi:transcriptional regulator with XRE-family HTH domain
VHVGEEIRRRRDDAKLSLEELGEKADLSANQLSKIENGKAKPSLETLEAIAGALKLSLRDLFGGADDLSAAALEVAHLFDAAEKETQRFVRHVLRHTPPPRR